LSCEQIRVLSRQGLCLTSLKKCSHVSTLSEIS
jgi:hypothetical protein